MQAHITNRTVAALRPGKSMGDDEVPGFRARRLPSGSVVFGFQYREPTPNGRQRFISLGVLGIITVAEARKLAKLARREHEARADTEERKRAKQRLGRVVERITERIDRP